MTPRMRPAIGVVAPAQHVEMLCEWLDAAGFEAVRVDASVCLVPTRPLAACLVRWPMDVELSSLPRPIVLLYEQGQDLREAVGRVAEVIAVPDSNDVRSLLDWSAQLGSMLRHVSSMQRSPVRCEVPDVEKVERQAAAASLIAIGVSTGGPTSLRVLFSGLAGAQLPPILIVQHIPAGFVSDLIQRLWDQTGYPFALAENGMTLANGVAYIAPGDAHVRVADVDGRPAVRWTHEAPFRGHRPSVEVLFDSCAELPVNGIAVMMTGMGQDGAQALRALRDRGWITIGQDRESCAIYGMPQAAKEAGAIERELPLEQIAPALLSLCRRAGAGVR